MQENLRDGRQVRKDPNVSMVIKVFFKGEQRLQVQTTGAINQTSAHSGAPRGLWTTRQHLVP